MSQVSNYDCAAAMRRMRAKRFQESYGEPYRERLLRVRNSAYISWCDDLIKYRGKTYSRASWQGQAVINGQRLNITRSVKKHGERGAYIQVVDRVAEWLYNAYPDLTDEITKRVDYWRGVSDGMDVQDRLQADAGGEGQAGEGGVSEVLRPDAPGEGTHQHPCGHTGLPW